MYLKALEIQGFKSFPDKTVLTFEHDITAIVGPNGSGKSNISDAIRWVMGEQSTKALRGGKMEDVIFGGTAKRKQLGFAEVSLVLDNTGRLFPMEESEIMVTRRYYRSGESEYFINRHAVRLRDVNELFMDTGLGREGYSIIGQGRIDEILSVKSADRREVFEEAAGISRYRHRKEEAERKLERTQENLVRVNDKIDELELQVEPLRAQAEKARKYLILRDELRGLEISLWMDQLDRIRAGAVKLNIDCEQAVRQKEEAQSRLEALYAAAEGYAAQMREKDIEAEGIRFRMQQREADANECQRAIAVLQAQIQSNLESAGRVRQELEAQEGRAGSIAAQIGERQARLDEIAARMEALKAALEEARRSDRDERSRAGTLQGELEALREKEAVETASAAEAKALLSALAAAAQELLDRDESIRRDLAAGEARLARLREEAAATQAELDQAREDRDALGNVLSGHQLRAEARQRKVKAAEELQVKLRMDEHALSSRIHMLAEMEKVYEGYSKAVKLVMGEAQRGSLRHIHGPVAGLVHVPDPYTVAIETALGGAMQHIVVESEEDGKAAIQALKRRDGGRCTFLPLSSIRPSDFRDAGVEDEPGFVGMGDRLVEFDPKYQRVFSNLLGRVVVAQDLDAAIAMARKYRYRFRVVTLDGQVLNPGGSMTGGSASRSAGILSRANELERLNTQIDGLRRELEEAVRALDEARREATAAAYDLETAQAQRRELESRLLQLEERWSAQGQSLSDVEAQQNAQRGELAQVEERSRQTEADTGAARARIEALEGSAAALRAEAQGKAAGQEEIRARMEAVNAKIAGLSLELASLEAEDAASRKALGELEALRRDLTGDRAQREGVLQEFQDKNRDLTGRIGAQEARLQAIRAENETRKEQVARLNQEKLELEAQRNRADRESRDKNSELLNLEREVSVLEQKKVAAGLEEQQLLDKLWETYELSHEAARAQRLELESAAQAQKRVGELKRTISGLGNINLDAIDEFQRVNERYTYLTGQRDDVQRSKDELERVIAEITGEMKAIFSRQFGIINAAFGETFCELFGGGRAALELDDPDDILNCGIEIRVQPPGKALKVLSLLSGGEKAFVAIALYFAILKVRPTPFCVMDEIEAALDDANVARFARYLRGMSGKTQFIVITHRRGTMEEADVLYGVTMQEQGISRLLTINLNDVEKELHLE
ncbi:chromosome segregation protein SMC [uncultured Intestinimonas sp.]|uniref:chromosome segregation protein SMC n=1 Tax=uncultured Intestinimonas sp. TaxID=1689265 RepID=UPI0025D727D8|nr:chromosome segregation protein SMC [uncultured Intestinimonas sp.]